ncbi:hypothetical protein ECG_01522 [Echinococcus granulosus]|nr:hypothetical protein ECG_01522 [Echinococcus granulosus]
MNCVVSTFLLDIFEQSEPNLEKFKGNLPYKCMVFEVLCNSVDVKSLDFSEIVEFGTMLLYTETLMLSSLIKIYQKKKQDASSESIHQISDRARAVLLQMDSQASFLSKKCPDLSTNTIRLGISCMKERKVEEWPRYHLKLSAAIHKLVSITIPIERESSNEAPCTKTIPFSMLFSQLSEFALHKNSDDHPSLWVDDAAVRSRVSDLYLCIRGRNGNEHHLVDEEKMVTSWQIALNFFHLPLSIATQTDAAIQLECLPQSTPNKSRPQVKRLLPGVNTNFLDGLSTPPDTPGKSPKPKVPKKARNLSLTLPSCDENDAASTATDCVARRRKPWTLSETLALWHEVQIALPGPPSWAKIRDKVFTSSRRTNVDLKDRWRVILRDPSLQMNIRQYYEKWLASKKPT